MYQSNSFYIERQNEIKNFSPQVHSIFNISADETYTHFNTEDEKSQHPENITAFIHCVDGKGEITLENGKKIILQKNKFVMLKFNDIVKYKSISNIWGYRWVNFVLKHPTEEFCLNKIYKASLTDNSNLIFNKMLNHATSKIQNENYIDALFSLYVYAIFLHKEQEEINYLTPNNKKLIDEICSYIDQKIYSKISVDEISDFFDISSRRLHQIFSKELGISPKKYIIDKKMKKAYKLITETSLPINKIAYSLSFSSPYHFSYEFTKIYHQAPSMIRKSELQKENIFKTDNSKDNK